MYISTSTDKGNKSYLLKLLVVTVCSWTKQSLTTQSLLSLLLRVTTSPCHIYYAPEDNGFVFLLFYSLYWLWKWMMMMMTNFPLKDGAEGYGVEMDCWSLGQCCMRWRMVSLHFLQMISTDLYQDSWGISFTVPLDFYGTVSSDGIFFCLEKPPLQSKGKDIRWVPTFSASVSRRYVNLLCVLVFNHCDIIFSTSHSTLRLLKCYGDYWS